VTGTRLAQLSRGLAAAVVGLVLVGPAVAQEATAGAWLADCAAYLGVLEGGDGSDLDIAYCSGLTLGILTGFETGAQLGAISMASTLTVLAALDEEEVLKLLRSLGSERLLRYCRPAGQPISAVILTVAGYVRASPERVQMPVGAAFFEALQAAHPCTEDPPPGE
jgi:hypothetical protein